MNKNIAIKVNNLTKSYKLYKQPIDRIKESLNIFGNKYHTKFDAVKDISFEIRQGETVGIIGRNGCGKSTLLKMISSVLTPSSGRVIVHGRISAILELGAGFNPEMTGLENIYLNSIINGLSKKQIDQKMNGILKFSELGEFIHQSVKTYSSGMKARLAFSVAINIEPDILIVDEALSVGDVAFQRKCFAKIEEIRANGATILFVSHSEQSIVSLCNRAIWLSQGEKVLDGLPKLVTGLYLKYSNEKFINKEKVFSEYQKIVNNMVVQKESLNKKKLSKTTETIFPSSLKEYYDSALKPTSTISYKENGAKIFDVRIINIEDRKVNALIQENDYKIRMQFELFECLNDVRLGIAIKDIKGNYFSGAAFELLKHNQIDGIKKGKYCIEWDFSCLIVEGVYVVDAVILKDFSSERVIVSKLNDCYIFKALKKENNSIIQSHVPMVKRCSFYEID
jgi:lipopolysaccharide transport system ATP-binding protein